MRKLNAGCGTNILEGYDNVDIQKEAPIVWDLNKIPYPFAKEDTYDYVLMNGVLEYLDKPEKVLDELRRICKSNATIQINSTYYNNKGSYNDFKIIHRFHEQTFKFLEYQIIKEEKFEIINIKLNPTHLGRKIPKMIRERLSVLISGLIGEVYVTLKVKK